MKLSEIKGQEAIDALADLMFPATEIFSDKKVVDLLRAGDKLKAIHAMLKGHSKAVIQMLAILDREDPETYEPSIVTLPLKLLEFLNDPEVNNLFFSQEQTKAENSSSPVTENIGEDPR